MMGNRGRIHRDDQTLSKSRWRLKPWIICVCAFRGRHRKVWGRSYTELFFLDELTALAAGHRPCFECRNQAAKSFLAAFPGKPSGADAMDEVLHRERLIGTQKRLWRARIGDLAEGVMIARGGLAYALRDGAAARWSFAGYGSPVVFDRNSEADVLTPPSTAAALAAGYRPEWTGVPA
jgi:hypothetical protein